MMRNRNKVVFVTAFFVLGLGHKTEKTYSFQDDNVPPAWDHVLKKWIAWESCERSMAIVTRTTPSDSSGDASGDRDSHIIQNQFDRKNGLLVAVKGEREMRVICNPDYIAEIEKVGQSTWQLRRASPWNSPSFLDERLEKFERKNKGAFNNIKLDWLGKLEPLIRPDTASNSENYILEFDFSSITEAKEKLVLKAEFTISPKVDWLPIRVAVMYDGAFRIFTYSDWDRINGRWVFKRYRSVASNSLHSDVGEYLELLYTYNEIPTKPNPEMCYLDFYGLAEPPIPPRKILSRWVGISIGCSLLLGLFILRYFWKKDQN